MYIYLYIHSIYQWFVNSFCIDWSNLLQIVSEFSEMWLFLEAAFIISVPPSNIWALMQGSTTRKCKKACCFNHRLAAVPLWKKTWKKNLSKQPLLYGIDCSCINNIFIYLQHFLLILVDSCGYFFPRLSASRKTSPPNLPQGPLAVWLCASKQSWPIRSTGWFKALMMAYDDRHGFSPNLGVSLNGGFFPRNWMVENNGKPYFLMDDRGGKPTILGNPRFCWSWSFWMPKVFG